jgi:hypothetical protein
MQKAVAAAFCSYAERNAAKAKRSKLIEFAQTAADQLVMPRPNQNAEVAQ